MQFSDDIGEVSLCSKWWFGQKFTVTVQNKPYVITPLQGSMTIVEEQVKRLSRPEVEELMTANGS